jgi:hypothetical protein
MITITRGRTRIILSHHFQTVNLTMTLTNVHGYLFDDMTIDLDSSSFDMNLGSKLINHIDNNSIFVFNPIAVRTSLSIGYIEYDYFHCL